MTHLGLIPPIPHLQEFAAGRPFHLALAHMVMDDDYRKFYKSEAAHGAFISLDNGAWENGGCESMDKLYATALAIGAKEIALPDVIGDMQATIEATSQALYWMSENIGNDMLRLMIIPQASSIYHWGQCLKIQVALIYAAFGRIVPFTIGLPKRYEVWHGGLPNLMQRFVIPVKRQYRDLVQIHMLGWGRQPRQVLTCVKNWGEDIRSIDTAKPFVAAMEGYTLTDEAVYQHNGRPDDFFETTIDIETELLAWDNVNVLENILSGIGLDSDVIKETLRHTA